VTIFSAVAIHDTTLGPSLGGYRMYPCADEAATLERAGLA
jgi:glutamate dehydrogenase/leucine dehydrogenase